MDDRLTLIVADRLVAFVFGLRCVVTCDLIIELRISDQPHHRLKRIAVVFIVLDRRPGIRAHGHAACKSDRPGIAPGLAVFVVGQHRRESLAFVEHGGHRKTVALDQLEQGRILALAAQSHRGALGLAQHHGQPFLARHRLRATGQRSAESVEFLDGHRIVWVDGDEPLFKQLDLGIGQGRVLGGCVHPDIVQG